MENSFDNWKIEAEKFKDAHLNFLKAVDGLESALLNVLLTTAKALSAKCGISAESCIWISEKMGIHILDLYDFYMETNRFPDDLEIKILLNDSLQNALSRL